MDRRRFLKLAGLATAGVAVGAVPFKDTQAFTPAVEPTPAALSAYEKLYREKQIEHMKDIENAFLFGVPVEEKETPFGVIRIINYHLENEIRS